MAGPAFVAGPLHALVLRVAQDDGLPDVLAPVTDRRRPIGGGLGHAVAAYPYVPADVARHADAAWRLIHGRALVAGPAQHPVTPDGSPVEPRHRLARIPAGLGRLRLAYGLLRHVLPAPRAEVAGVLTPRSTVAQASPTVPSRVHGRTAEVAYPFASTGLLVPVAAEGLQVLVGPVRHRRVRLRPASVSNGRTCPTKVASFLVT